MAIRRACAALMSLDVRTEPSWHGGPTPAGLRPSSGRYRHPEGGVILIGTRHDAALGFAARAVATTDRSGGQHL